MAEPERAALAVDQIMQLTTAQAQAPPPRCGPVPSSQKPAIHGSYRSQAGMRCRMPDVAQHMSQEPPGRRPRQAERSSNGSTPGGGVISSTSSMFSSRPYRMTSNVRRINCLLAGSTVERERKRA
jgi:hypothetical protein